MVQGTYQLPIPAGKEVAIIHLHGVTDTPESAQKFVQTFKESKMLQTIPPEIRKIIVNFSAGQGYVGDRELLRGDVFDVVEIRGGDQMRGTLRDKTYTLNTFYGNVSLPADRTGAAHTRCAQVLTRHRLSGSWLAQYRQLTEWVGG